MKRYEGSPAVVIERRKGTPDSPFSNMNESLVVTGDGKVLLSEIPNELNRVKVSSDENTTWYEITEDLIPENGFKVDYINKIVTFNTIHVGKQLHFKYLGEGNHFYSPHSIYTKLEDKTVVETLGDIVEGGKNALDALGALNEKLDEVTQATNNAITATNDTMDVIQRGEQVIVDANSKVNDLDEKIVIIDDKLLTTDIKLNEVNEVLVEVDNTIKTADQSINNINGVINEAVQTTVNAQILIDEAKSVGDFVLSKQYKKNNTVLNNGSTWIALQDTINNPLPVLPIRENTYWRLVAQKGIDGTGAVSSVNGVLPDSNGNVQLDLGSQTLITEKSFAEGSNMYPDGLSSFVATSATAQGWNDLVGASATGIVVETTNKQGVDGWTIQKISYFSGAELEFIYQRHFDRGRGSKWQDPIKVYPYHDDVFAGEGTYDLMLSDKVGDSDIFKSVTRLVHGKTDGVYSQLKESVLGSGIYDLLEVKVGDGTSFTQTMSYQLTYVEGAVTKVDRIV